MIRKLKSGQYRLYSLSRDPETGKRRNLGTFETRAQAEQHEREVESSNAEDIEGGPPRELLHTVAPFSRAGRPAGHGRRGPWAPAGPPVRALLVAVTMPDTTIAVIGSGAWGTALACHGVRRGHRVRMWALEPDVAREIKTHHTNSLYLPDMPLPDSIRGRTTSAEAVRDAEFVVLAPPSTHLRAVSSSGGAVAARDAVVVVATKGFQAGRLPLMSQVLVQTMPDARRRPPGVPLRAELRPRGRERAADRRGGGVAGDGGRGKRAAAAPLAVSSGCTRATTRSACRSVAR